MVGRAEERIMRTSLKCLQKPRVRSQMWGPLFFLELSGGLNAEHPPGGALVKQAAEPEVDGGHTFVPPLFALKK